MTWQRRIAELVVAGGSLGGCVLHRGIPCGNADPDPCVCNRTPANAPQCVAEAKCEAAGYQWAFFDPPDAVTDAGVELEGHCDTPDAAVVEDAQPGDAARAD